MDRINSFVLASRWSSTKEPPRPPEVGPDWVWMPATLHRPAGWMDPASRTDYVVGWLTILCTAGAAIAMTLALCAWSHT